MFPCTSCGLCCQNISNIKELKDFDLGNGICKYFDSLSNSCSIYENRPVICRVDEMYDIEYNKYFTKKDFYIQNAMVCNKLQDKYKLNDSFRVIIGE
jgi:Fe-S-cluster containining protein